MRSSRLTGIGGVVAALALAVAGLTVSPTAVGAQTNPYERGPAPTAQSVVQPRGPFATTTTAVPASAATGFNRGTIYHPTDTSQTYGGVAVIPGFVSPESFVAWTGPYLASNGFVVMTLEPFSGFDLPGSRATQLQAALDYLADSSPVASIVDGDRLAAAGHSMGGGGALQAGLDNPDLEAVVGFQPWNLFVSYRNLRVPSLQVGVSDDFIAPPGSNAEVFYEQIPAASEKAYIEIGAGGHFLGNVFNVEQARQTLAWLKRYVDDDTRYSQFLCPPPTGGLIVEYRDTCPD
jgi:dienelactone hydrolase